MKRISIFGNRARWLLCTVTLLLVATAVAQRQNATQIARSFDHLSTGFELEGAHRSADCEGCHVNAVFKGTPRTCAGCHALSARIPVSSKPVTHILSSERCDACHLNSQWIPVTHFSHDDARGTCRSCHNGVYSTSQTINHIVTTADCQTCHRSSVWLPVFFSHDGITSNCVSCHDGFRANGKTPNHRPASNVCESCHFSTTVWR